MPGPFTHRIDPVLADLGGVYLWWYGLSYTLGFLELLFYLRRRRRVIGLTLPEAYSLTLFFIVGVLIGGRAVEVAFDEWPFYREHPALIPALWLGGMATHGLLAGAAAAIWSFCRLHRKPLREIADALVVPGAFFLGIGRIGNFIDGQIVGGVTDVWWGVQFPDADGFRHPVVLYDGVKNLLLIPLLIWIGSRRPIPGARSAHFVFWYAFLRLFVDLFRDYPSHRLALGTGQTLNIVMAAVGVVLIVRSERRWRTREMRVGTCETLAATAAAARPAARSLGWQRLGVALLLAFCLAIPGNWTQDVPARYGKRHSGLRHSRLYPEIRTAPPGAGAAGLVNTTRESRSTR
jgi:phosphatidylglycerol---prolipoprotein diacylglyceryl transferase